MLTFQSTLPARGATFEHGDIARLKSDFNPRSPHGERQITAHTTSISGLFQSTLPARGATVMEAMLLAVEHISIHAPRTGSDMTQYLNTERVAISIHAPRTGSDQKWKDYYRAQSISIHAPRTGSDYTDKTMWISTDISIHAPRTGSDSAADISNGTEPGFQSTLPARGATGFKFRGIDDVIFQSTLPARGATLGARRHGCRPHNFNPRSPHGERPRPAQSRRCLALVFQSTLPARGATFVRQCVVFRLVDFNPRSPHGERRPWISA